MINTCDSSNVHILDSCAETSTSLSSAPSISMLVSRELSEARALCVYDVLDMKIFATCNLWDLQRSTLNCLAIYSSFVLILFSPQLLLFFSSMNSVWAWSGPDLALQWWSGHLCSYAQTIYNSIKATAVKGACFQEILQDSEESRTVLDLNWMFTTLVIIVCFSADHLISLNI